MDSARQHKHTTILYAFFNHANKKTSSWLDLLPQLDRKDYYTILTVPSMPANWNDFLTTEARFHNHSSSHDMVLQQHQTSIYELILLPCYTTYDIHLCLKILITERNSDLQQHLQQNLESCLPLPWHWIKLVKHHWLAQLHSHCHSFCLLSETKSLFSKANLPSRSQI